MTSGVNNLESQASVQPINTGIREYPTTDLILSLSTLPPKVLERRASILIETFQICKNIMYNRMGCTAKIKRFMKNFPDNLICISISKSKEFLNPVISSVPNRGIDIGTRMGKSMTK